MRIAIPCGFEGKRNIQIVVMVQLVLMEHVVHLMSAQLVKVFIMVFVQNIILIVRPIPDHPEMEIVHVMMDFIRPIGKVI